MNEVGFTVSQCIDFVKNIQQQANDVVEIRTLMTTDKYNIFTTALKRIGNALIMLSNVFTSNNNIENDHNKLFEYNNLKLSQIETIGVKLAPIQELFDLLAELYFYNSQFCVRFRVKLRALYKLYIRFKKPSTLKRRLYKHFKDIEELLPLVIELKRTIFGSAQRIRHPIMRKAWMLAGENQLNDSSLPSNILQDNLYMLLDSELGEDVINKWEIKDRFKNGIAYIVDDIDNRGTTKGDNNISIAELNDLPLVMFEYLPKNQDNEFNIDADNDESTRDNISTKKQNNDKNNGGNRYLCMFNQQISANDTDSDIEADDDIITTNKNTNILKEYEYNCTQHFFDVYTNYLQGTWFATKKAILQEKLELIQAKQDKKYAEQNNPDNIAEYTTKVDKLQTKIVIQEQNDIEHRIKLFDNMQNLLHPLYSDLIILPLLLEYKKGSPQLTAGIKRKEDLDIDDIVDSPTKTKGYITNFIHSSQNIMYHPPCVSDYGHEYPCIQLVQEEVVFGKYMETTIDNNKYQLTNICFNIVAHDQNQGGTGKVHIRYQINKGKCIKAFTIIRQRKKKKNGKPNNNNTPPDTYKFNINRHEIFKNRKNMTDAEPQTITLWLFCPGESGWSATVKSIKCEHKYSYIGNGN